MKASDRSERDEWEGLLDDYFESELDELGHARLSALLQKDAEVRQEFWRRANLESSLESWGQRARGEAIALTTLPLRNVRP